MGFLSDRHRNAELLMFSDYSGGLNLSKPPESIAANEMQEAVNLEFSPNTGMLRLRSGVELVYTFEEPVTDIISILEPDLLLVKSGNKLHKMATSGLSAEELGEVVGDKPATYEQWGEAELKGTLLAFGGPLYQYDPGDGLVRIEDIEEVPVEDGEEGETEEKDISPQSVEILFVMGGRVLVAEAGSDEIRYSGVGDPANWKDGSDSDSISIEVGYKDGCSMRAIAAIAGELIIFKCPDGQPDKGRIYRLQGNYPEWSLSLYARGNSAWNHQSVANVSNDILFLAREGLGNIATVTEYGDYKLGWAGAKVNPRLSMLLSKACRLWHLQSRSQVWVSDGTNEELWIYHYQIGGGAWTNLHFPGKVDSVVEAADGIYLAIGNSVYRMRDEVYDDMGAPITARWKPGTLIRHNQILLKGVVASYQSIEEANAILRVEGFELPLRLAGHGGDIAFTDNDIAFLDDDPLVPDSWTFRTEIVRRRCNIRRWSLTPEITIQNGAFNLLSVGLEVAEV